MLDRSSSKVWNWVNYIPFQKEATTFLLRSIMRGKEFDPGSFWVFINYLIAVIISSYFAVII